MIYSELFYCWLLQLRYSRGFCLAHITLHYISCISGTRDSVKRCNAVQTGTASVAIYWSGHWLRTWTSNNNNAEWGVVPIKKSLAFTAYRNNGKDHKCFPSSLLVTSVANVKRLFREFAGNQRKSFFFFSQTNKKNPKISNIQNKKDTFKTLHSALTKCLGWNEWIS